MALQTEQKRRKQAPKMVEGRDEENNRNRSVKSKRRSKRHQPSAHHQFRRYAYSAITATFFFVTLREIGFVDNIAASLKEKQSDFALRRNTVTRSTHTNLASAAATMAATSMSMGQQMSSNNIISSSSSMEFSNSQLARAEIMDRAKMQDSSIVVGSRPIIYTFFEWIPPRNRGTSMSDAADKTLLLEWKTAWKTAGWHPIVLTLDDAKQHPDYAAFNEKMTKIPMLGVDGGGGTVMYNQLCYLRWLAVAAKGGGFMADYDVFPISKARKTLEVPYDGKFAVYCQIKHSKNAGIPCLMSGSGDEWTRMAHAVLENGEKNANTETMWSDMLSLIDLRNSGAYSIHDSVLEGQDVLLRREWSESDCDVTANKHAVHFSHESLKLGYLPSGQSAEDRPAIISQFLEVWGKACGEREKEKATIGSQ
mmetsp:Transcript_17947/g.26564  ORF Transcript_17947/g.26564 Transcript_17947/m.26564 type:complete len:422 (+) Transcript_17947:53-1318(+)